MGKVLISHFIYISVLCIFVCIVSLFRNERIKKGERKLSISESTIIKAIGKKEFFIVYQPQVDISNGELYGLEALIRWKDSDGNLISPQEFISIAEESDAIKYLGRYVIEEVCKQISNWNKESHRFGHLSVNISAVELRDNDTIDFINEMIKKYMIEANQLIFEITESNSARSHKSIIENLHSLSRLGVSIAIDDFGKEYSALSYLTDLPVNIIKIDKIFVDKVIYDNRIMKMIVSLAESMDMKVIAEGVETKEQLERINEIGCVLIQGYYYEKPLHPQKIENKYFNKVDLSGVI